MKEKRLKEIQEADEAEKRRDDAGKELSQFMKDLTRYQAQARDRFPEYLNTHYSDATFEQRTLYEMLMEFSRRLKTLEEVMAPAPENVTEDEKKVKFY